MIEKILHTLKTLDIETYRINETASQSAECFFVRKRMDLKRRTTLTDYSVTVFRPLEKDGQQLLGSSSVPVYPGMEEDELREILASAWHAASLAGNPYYELISGQKEDLIPSRSAFAGKGLEENLKAMAEALFAADVHEDVFLNSAEIFAVKQTHRVINSSGVDVSWETYEVKGEYVVQCVTPSDVETYHQFSYREPDATALRSDVENALTQTRDRAAAAQPPRAGEYTVILSGQHMRELLSYYLGRSGSGMVYQKYSNWAAGQAVQGEDIQGDSLTISLRAVDPCDDEGIPMTDRPLMENGVLKTIHGGGRFAYYLGIEPTGQYRCIEVPTGSTPLADMKKQPHLHIVAFSDFQMNAMSGHFGGEIRLAYLYDGETVTPVTGGSVNGSILAAQRHMVFSRERYQSGNYDGPFAVAIQGVAIAGQSES